MTLSELIRELQILEKKGFNDFSVKFEYSWGQEKFVVGVHEFEQTKDIILW